MVEVIISAENSLASPFVKVGIDSENPEDELFLWIAEQTQWLLEHPETAFPLTSLRCGNQSSFSASC